MPNYKIVLEYDGTRFSGSQRQKNAHTVQAELENALSTVLRENIIFVLSGRTDSGVHARAQVANFKTKRARDTGRLLNSINGILPKDIAVKSIETVPDDYHARFSSTERRYRYYISTDKPALRRSFVWHFKHTLDLDLLNAAASLLHGEHDFAAFCSAKSAVSHHFCTVKSARWFTDDGLIIFEIAANRFLHHMVRLLVGTMTKVGAGKVPVSHFDAALKSKVKSRIIYKAPASGLVLFEVK